LASQLGEDALNVVGIVRRMLRKSERIIRKISNFNDNECPGGDKMGGRFDGTYNDNDNVKKIDQEYHIPDYMFNVVPASQTDPLDTKDIDLEVDQRELICDSEDPGDDV
jgi:hypothetical protein